MLYNINVRRNGLQGGGKGFLITELPEPGGPIPEGTLFCRTNESTDGDDFLRLLPTGGAIGPMGDVLHRLLDMQDLELEQMGSEVMRLDMPRLDEHIWRNMSIASISRCLGNINWRQTWPVVDRSTNCTQM